tara:strand:- start:305 stop:493 length:189 start_codon:yes stop_codon:yes gene_type:complete
MKKSNLNPKELLKVINKTFDLLKEIEETDDISNLDLNKIQKEANNIKEKVEKYYSNNLDSKK